MAKRGKNIVVITGEEFKEVCKNKNGLGCRRYTINQSPKFCNLITCPDWKRLKRIPVYKIKGEM